MRRSDETLDASPRDLRRLGVLFSGVLVYLIAMLALRALRSEPYPAVLLPSGGGVYPYTSDYVRFERTDLMACDGRRVCVDVSMHDLLADFPGSVRPYIVRNRFGLGGLDAAPVIGPPPVAIHSPARQVADRQATRQWLAERLGSLTGLACTEVLFVRRTYEVSLHPERTYHVLDEVVAATVAL